MFALYALRVWPGLAMLTFLLILLPTRAAELRLVAYLFAFVLARDVMTPIGLWSISGDLSLRFAPDPVSLATLGLSSAALSALILRVEPGLASLVVWWRGPRQRAVIAGIAIALLGALPVHLGYILSGPHREAPPLRELPALALLALLGNFLEELLFRGFLQGLVEQHVGARRAILISGTFFAACHTFLALSVTSIGWPVLLFTLYEGTLAAWVRTRFGLIAATLTHGGLIFLLSSGLA
jgi:membrane protease YdiL (CAAX protease family)